MDLLSSFDSNPSSAVLTYKATIEEKEHCLFLKNPAMRVPFRSHELHQQHVFCIVLLCIYLIKAVCLSGR